MIKLTPVIPFNKSYQSKSSDKNINFGAKSTQIKPNTSGRTHDIFESPQSAMNKALHPANSEPVSAILQQALQLLVNGKEENDDAACKLISEAHDIVENDNFYDKKARELIKEIYRIATERPAESETKAEKRARDEFNTGRKYYIKANNPKESETKTDSLRYAKIKFENAWTMNPKNTNIYPCMALVNCELNDKKFAKTIMPGISDERFEEIVANCQEELLSKKGSKEIY